MAEAKDSSRHYSALGDSDAILLELRKGSRQKSKFISDILDNEDIFSPHDGWDAINTHFKLNISVDVIKRIRHRGKILNLVRIKNEILNDKSKTYHLIPETERITNVLSSFHSVGMGCDDLWSVNDMITYSDYVTLHYCSYFFNWRVSNWSERHLPKLAATIDETWLNQEKYNYHDLLGHKFTFPETLKNREKFVAYIVQNYRFRLTQDWSSLPVETEYIIVAIFSPFNMVISEEGEQYYFLRENETIQTLLYKTALCSSDIRDFSSDPISETGCDILMRGDEKVIEIARHDYTYDGEPTMDLYRLIDMDRIVK